MKRQIAYSGKQSVGLTLIELMVTLALLVTVLAVGTPAFQKMMANNRSTSNANLMVSILRQARSEAVNRSEAVSICARANANNCGTDWSKGILVFTDKSGIGAYAPGSEEKINEWKAFEGAITISSTPAGRYFVRFLPSGDRDENNGADTLLIKFSNCTGKQDRTVHISNTGLTSVDQVSC